MNSLEGVVGHIMSGALLGRGSCRPTHVCAGLSAFDSGKQVRLKGLPRLPLAAAQLYSWLQTSASCNLSSFARGREFYVYACNALGLNYTQGQDKFGSFPIPLATFEVYSPEQHRTPESTHAG